ncbi:MAG: ribose-phosphate diphosphokinase [Gammaproteobacteria bacterium]
MRVLGFPDYEPQARALADALDAPCDIVDIHRFPDGESRVRLSADLGGEVLLCRSLDQPNDKLVDLLLAAGGARSIGATHLTLVAPYLCYMRQDKSFVPGEVVSQQVVGRFLAGCFDGIVTVDPHLHRVSSLAEAVPAARAVALSAAPAMGEYLAARGARPLLVGPDQESEQWLRTVAHRARLDYAVARKIRRGDRDVEIILPERSYAGFEVVLVDDMASTGRTLAGAARALTAAGAVRVDALVTHALFVGDALDVMVGAGIGEIWSSDSVSHPSNAFALADTLASAIAERNADK